MKEAWGRVVGGKIVLPEGTVLPDGVQVHVFWGDRPDEVLPLEREEWTREDLERELKALRRPVARR